MNSFSLDISKFVHKAPDRAEQIVKRVCFDIYENVKVRTPVDTGRARAGWMLDSGKTITRIYNNVEYIVPLEYGHSKKQAPAGMVRITLRQYKKYIRKAAAGL